MVNVTASTHTREEHSFFDTLTMTQAERLAARESCAVCRTIFNAAGDFRGEAWGQRSERNVKRAATIARITGRPQGHEAIPASPHRPASDAQLSFLKKLVDSRDCTAVQEQLAFARRAAIAKTLTSAQASSLIDTLKSQPWKPSQPQTATQPVSAPDHGETPSRHPWPKVDEGRYALRDVPGYENEIAFFKVSRPTDGPFRGRTFVKQYKSDEEMPVRGEGARKVLELIALDPKAATILFGQETEHCGHCGRRLTDDESRARGIGPTCASKLGW